MKKTQLLDARRNIRKELVAFLSIVVIGLLASVAYLGITYSAAALKKDAVNFFNSQELWDTEAVSTMLMTDSCPTAEMVTYHFPARPNMPKLALPECELTWYDGGIVNKLPFDMPKGKKFDGNGVCVFYGTKDTMVVGTYGNQPFLVSGREPIVPELCRIVPNDNHQQDWIRACKEPADSRVETVRLQELGQWLDWDGENMKFTNIPADAKVRPSNEIKFSIKDGHPTFKNNDTTPMDANEYAANLIKPIYYNGYKLPEIPVL